MAYVVTEACVDIMDRSCITVCPVNCISPGERMLYINPNVCIDCGACESACPQEAIVMDEGDSGSHEVFRQINAEFFQSEEFGPSSVTRSTPIDHPFVSGLPC